MRKFWLTISTTSAFVIYILFQRHASQQPVILPPPSLQSPSSSAVSDSTAAASPLSSTADSQIGTSKPVAKAPVKNNPSPSPSASQSNPVSNPTPAPAPQSQPKPQGQYKDGQYVGSSADAYYGIVQVKAIISGGKITDVQFLSHPSDRSTSRYINSQAMPYLTQEAILAQNANVDIVSGATDTSQAFVESLGAALAQAKI